MAPGRYGSRRVRFTWRGRSVIRSAPGTSQKVLLDSKDQRTHGGKCSFFGVCTALEAHQRLKTNQPCPNLSWIDLERKVRAHANYGVRGHGRIGICLAILRSTGVCYEGSEDTVKIKEFESIDTMSQSDIDKAVRKYMKEGPMIGTFEVHGDGADWMRYGQSEFLDELYVVNSTPGEPKFTHVVVITGFGVQGNYPFWEFQNSYGPEWRGASRGFGQIYAIHLRWLYGFILA